MARGPRPTAASSRACARSPRSSPRKQEKVLVFTQFREITAPLAAFLGIGVRPAGAGAARRDRGEEAPGAGPAVSGGRNACRSSCSRSRRAAPGLNLTAASHVIHFDRWWNPAVENQATDRAFRIGQTKNVLVHKFVCRGTVEEKIDQLIDSKRQLSQDLLEGGADLLLTEMNDDELLKLVALDLHAASQEIDGWITTTMEALRAGGRRAGARRRASWRSCRKKGHDVSPVVIEGRDDRARRSGARPGATTSSATATYANRLPRGRTYVRNGSVVDLQIAPGKVTALVSGSELYEVG